MNLGRPRFRERPNPERVGRTSDPGRACHHRERRQGAAKPAEAPSSFEAISPAYGPGGIAHHPPQDAHPPRSRDGLRKGRNAGPAPRSSRAYPDFHGRGFREKPKKISHAPSLSWHHEPVRVVPMIASYQIRHTKQMKEIAAALPKTVTALYK